MADSKHFFMAMEHVPTATKQEKKVRWTKNSRGTKVPVFYPSEAWSDAEASLRAHLEQHKPSKPMCGPVVLDVTWCFPKDGYADGEPYTKKPDTDNLQKGLKDVMTELGWWKDDAQVFSEHATKIHSRITGIRIDIEEIEEPQ